MSIALRDQLIKSIIFQFGEPCRESLSIDDTRQASRENKGRMGSEKMRPPPLSAKEENLFGKLMALRFDALPHFYVYKLL